MKTFMLGFGAAGLLFYLWATVRDARAGRADIGKWGNYIHRTKSPTWFWITLAFNLSLAAVGGFALSVWTIHGK